MMMRMMMMMMMNELTLTWHRVLRLQKHITVKEESRIEFFLVSGLATCS